jgi:hypothetical protein
VLRQSGGEAGLLSGAQAGARYIPGARGGREKVIGET